MGCVVGLAGMVPWGNWGEGSLVTAQDGLKGIHTSILGLKITTPHRHRPQR